jgi:hypothetical protein
MRQTFLVMILVLGIVFTSPLFALAADSAEAKEKQAVETEKEKKGMTPQTDDQKEKRILKGLESQNQKSIEPSSMPVYQPPRRGAPGGRVGGGTRGIGDELITLYVLAPNHVGLTVEEQPTLYWYLSKSINLPIEVTIIEDQAVYPLLEKRISLPVQQGIHPIRLKDYNIHLSPGKEYRWFLAVVPAPDRRSRDIIAGGMISRVESQEALRVKLTQADRKEIPRIYAEAGIWYDAVTAISDLMDEVPNDTLLRKQRAALLKQVGLSEVADQEMK